MKNCKKRDLEPIKKIIKDNIENGDCGIYNTRSLAGDSMTNLYNENGVQIDICEDYAYFEIFGLTDEEFEEIENFYESIGCLIF